MFSNFIHVYSVKSKEDIPIYNNSSVTNTQGFSLKGSLKAITKLFKKFAGKIQS